MAFELPPLPYDYASLEPSIDTLTMQIHHDKHHAAYVNNLNAAIKDYADIANKDIIEILKNLNDVPEAIRAAVRNNGGGHANHTLFWNTLSGNGGQPSGALATAINSTFGDLASLQEKLNDAGVKRFGSGWAWLVVDNGKLVVTSTPNQDSPYSDGQTPIFGIDVWEHAYYLNYQNRRPDYLKAIWNVVNWAAVGENYEKAIG
jgi:Fe-Mn family superoxide dismutase